MECGIQPIAQALVESCSWFELFQPTNTPSLGIVAFWFQICQMLSDLTEIKCHFFWKYDKSNFLVLSLLDSNQFYQREGEF